MIPKSQRVNRAFHKKQELSSLLVPHEGKHLEELREIGETWLAGMEEYDQYGDSATLTTSFRALSSNDRIRLLAIAFSHHKADVRRAAELIAEMYQLGRLERLLELLTPSERAEIDRLRQTPWLHVEYARIEEQLEGVVAEIGSLKFEDAYFILIPESGSTPATWIRAVGGDGLEILQWSNQVSFRPTSLELRMLLASMWESSCMLHIHNHPSSAKYGLQPSEADFGVAQWWKSLRPEFENGKMRFFIVGTSTWLEYH